MEIKKLREIYTVRICNGSGVIVKPLDRGCLYILTCYHVLFDKDKNDAEVPFSYSFDKESSLSSLTIDVADKLLCKDKDLAILKIKVDNPDNFEFIRLSSGGTASYHIGFPESRYVKAVSNTQVLSIVRQVSDVGHLFEYEYDKTVSKDEIEGMSGGGVFDKDLRLVGIHKQNSVDDNKECLGKFCYIPIRYYKELLSEAGWSPIQEFNLDSFEEFLKLTFIIDDVIARKGVMLLLTQISSRRDMIKKWSPIRIISLLKSHGFLNCKVKHDEISRDLWIDFSEFIVAMLILLDITDEEEEDFIITAFKQFHFVFCENEFDLFDVRRKLDVSLISDLNTDKKIVIGGLKEPKSLCSCIMTPEIPDIDRAPFKETPFGKLLDITQTQELALGYMTFIHGKIFKRGIYYLADSDRSMRNIDNYRRILLEKINGAYDESSRN